jgi:hypothetical protein
MGIDDSVSLIHRTYYMMDWAKLAQRPSETRCLSCGGVMMVTAEPLSDSKGAAFDGLVCHACKTVLWARRGRTDVAPLEPGDLPDDGDDGDKVDGVPV